MKVAMLAIGLLLPSARRMVAYWLVVVAWVLVVSAGLEPTGARSALLWGLELRGFGMSAEEVVERAYLEMMFHVWTLVTLPFACFVAFRPLMRTFRGDFQQFLRYGRRSCLFIEGTRLGALAVTYAGVAAPFAVGGLIGRWRHGLGWVPCFDGVAACAGSILFVAVIVYLVASLRFPTEIASASGLLAPFLLTGISSAFDRADGQSSGSLLPPGLPHSVESHASPSLRAAFVYVGIVVLARLAVNLRTRWLTAPPSSQ